MTNEQIAILNATFCEMQKSEWKYCKCARVLATAAESLGFLDADSHHCLFTEGARNAAKIEELYGILIALTKRTNLLDGQGNLGGDDWGPADPLFTECALTQHGEDFVAGWIQDQQAEQAGSSNGG